MRNLVAGLFLLGLGSAQALAQAPLHLSLEGGAACSRNKGVLEFPDGTKIGDKGCGGTGAIEIGRTGQTVLQFFDHWALRGRFTSFEQDRTVTDAGDVVAVNFKDTRFVLDAEVGRKLGFGLFGGTSRLTLGLRYATWGGDLHGTVTAGPSIGDDARIELEAWGIGPRIGLRSFIPLGSHWMYESQMGAAVLFGRHRATAFDNGVLDTSASATSQSFSIDTSSALSYKFDGTDTGMIGSVGLFSEYWFKQIDVNGFNKGRHSWGPFVRVRMPLAQ